MAHTARSESSPWNSGDQSSMFHVCEACEGIKGSTCSTMLYTTNIVGIYIYIINAIQYMIIHSEGACTNKNMFSSSDQKMIEHVLL